MKVGLYTACASAGNPAWVHAVYELLSQQADKPGVYTSCGLDKDTYTQANLGFVREDFFKLGPIITSTAPLAPFLEEGQLQVQVVMHSVDGVTCGDVGDGTDNGVTHHSRLRQLRAQGARRGIKVTAASGVAVHCCTWLGA